MQRMTFCGATSKHLLPVLGLMLLAYCQLAQCQVQAFDCYLDCSFEAASQQDASCDQIKSTTECFDVNYDICAIDDRVNEVFIGVFTARDLCPTPETNFQCPSTPSYAFGDPDLTMDLGEANITPEPHACAIDPPDAMSQCSMFTYSHLRSFKGYRTGLETCTVPGEWFLLKHSALGVVVESEAVPGSNLTRLTKVNVTFSPTPCIGESPLSYVATNELPLPLTLTNGQTPDNSNSALQLKHTANSSAITILAVWINTTIIIRQYGNALSVVVQLPGELSFRSEGLCRGCPKHAYFNVTKKNSEVSSYCGRQTDAAISRCFVESELVNQDEFEGISNNTYFDYCLFDLHRTANIDAVSMLKAIGRDSILIPGRGFVPVVILPTIETPSYATLAESETTLPLTTTTTTTITTRRVQTTNTVPMTTTEDADFDMFSSASILSQLNFVTLLGLLLCTLASRYLIR